MMKKVFAAILVAVMAVSVAACNNNDNQNSSAGNNTTSTEGSKTIASIYENVEADPETAKKVAEYVDSENLGSKTQTMLRVLESKTIKIALSTKLSMSDLTGANSPASQASEEDESQKITMKLEFARSGDKNVFFSYNMSQSAMNMGLGFLNNADGAYMINDSAKQYAKLDTPESSETSENSAETSETSESSSDLSSTLSQFGLSTDDLKINKPTIQYNGESEDSFNGTTYSCESYTITAASDSSMAEGEKVLEDSEGSQTENKEAVTFKVYFDGEVPKGFSAVSDDEKNRFDISIDTFTTEVPDSDFVLNTDYTEVTSEDMMTALFSMMGLPSSMITTPQIENSTTEITE